MEAATDGVTVTTAPCTRRLSSILAQDGAKACLIAGLAVTTEHFSKRSKTPAGGVLSTRGLTAFDQALVGASDSLCMSALSTWLELAI